MKELLDLKKAIEGENAKLKEANTGLKLNIGQIETKLSNSEAINKTLEEDITRLKALNKELEDRVASESKNLTETRLQMKEIEKSSISQNLGFEAEKEHFILVNQEIGIIVF